MPDTLFRMFELDMFLDLLSVDTIRNHFSLMVWGKRWMWRSLNCYVQSSPFHVIYMSIANDRVVLQAKREPTDSDCLPLKSKTSGPAKAFAAKTELATAFKVVF